jgi:hypothetical protein
MDKTPYIKIILIPLKKMEFIKLVEQINSLSR